MSSTITALTSGGGLAMAGDTSGVLELKTNNGTTAVTIDASQNVGIGTSTVYAGAKAQVNGQLIVGAGVTASNIYGACLYARQGTDKVFAIQSGTADTSGIKLNTFNDSGSANIPLEVNGSVFIAKTGETERMRIDSSGQLLVGTTTQFGVGYGNIQVYQTDVGKNGMSVKFAATSGTLYMAAFYNGNNTIVGSISSNGTTTSYNTSSDYRLKENIAPMQGALDVVQQLKPVTYNWKADGSSGQGFIAHELQAVVPDCVTGEKDAVETVNDVDAEGKVIGTKEVPKYQGIDTSFLVATLTAAIQELNAKVDAQALEIATLKGTV